MQHVHMYLAVGLSPSTTVTEEGPVFGEGKLVVLVTDLGTHRADAGVLG